MAPLRIDPPAEALDHPSVKRIGRVARALGTLADEVVFIGGAIAPLLQLAAPFEAARPTTDVDGIIASTGYPDLARLATKLREREFRQGPENSQHVHRWLSPGGDVLDLVPAGPHLGGSGQTWDGVAINSCVLANLGDDLLIRHASAPAFLCLKWAAYDDRGCADPYSSHDLEDIVALVASRPIITEEIMAAERKVKSFIAQHIKDFMTDERRDDMLAAHLNNAQDPFETSRLVLERFEAIRSLPSST